jgi:hypothetical protein
MASPLDMKAEADVHFLQGINQLIGHGWPYTAAGVAYPGWRFYAAGVFNEKNPWWIVMPDVSRYLQRVSALLRQGEPVNDIALYLPNDDAWAAFVPGKVGSFIDTLAQRLGPDIMPAILDAGFNLDFVDDMAIASLAKPGQGALAIGSNRYRAIVLPDVERMPPATLRAIEGFAKQGVGVFATRRTPGRAPGYQASAADHADVQQTADRLFRGASPAGVFVERDADLGASLTSRLVPDMAVSAGSGDIGFVHRRTSAADLYFVANTSNRPRAIDAAFRVDARQWQRWDPLDGTIVPGTARRAPGRTGATISLELAPYGSAVVVFPSSSDPLPEAPAKPAVAPPSPVDISGGWRVRFGGGATEDWPALRSWIDDERTRHFSGVASYEKTVDVPAAFLRPGQSVRIDFGAPSPVEPGGPRARFQAWLSAPVREAAVVYVNGRRAGSAWCPPYAVEITPQLRPGLNDIRIEVANLAINHMAGRALPDYKLLNLRYGTRFEPQDMDKVQPVPAGLLGPIRLVAAPAAPRAASTR